MRDSGFPGAHTHLLTGWKESSITTLHAVRRGAFAVVLALIALALIQSCSQQKLGGLVLPNQPPTVELSQVPAPADTSGTYVYELSWAGFDADGRVVGYFYTLDPPSVTGSDTVWVGTHANRATFTFRADSITSGQATRARSFHTVAVYCMDDRGTRSPVVFASFTSTTVAPTVHILSPSPSALLSAALAPAVRIDWSGDDPDGVGSRLPAYYRTRLFPETADLSVDDILANPDTLRVLHAPAFADWDSLPGAAHGTELRNMTPGQRYVFAVVAVDRAGAYSPVFSPTSNLLAFHVESAASLGPVITLSSPSFSFTFPGGGIFISPDSFVHAEFAADAPFQLSWSAKPNSGSFISGYRWAIDIASLDDATPRADESADFAHWSRSSPSTSITLPAFSPPPGRTAETHLFYLEADDDLGLRSLAVLQFTVVRPTFDRELLVVDDTWFAPDRGLVGSCVASPSGNWPAAAELDTFLYAVGDKPWRCYPTGSRSTPGLFAGYAFDTLSTHLTPANQLTLQKLGHYRNIIWMNDLNSAFFFELDAHTTIRPRPLLREWTTPPAQDPLVIWIQQGGRLWMLGGGAAMASLRSFNAARSPDNTFSNALGELVPGSLLYDSAHWRSEVTMLRSTRAVRSPRAVGGWAGAPDYSRLPGTLDEKSPATDPVPPLRASGFYQTAYFAEYLSKFNRVGENDPSDPASPTVSALDTLYETVGGESGSGFPLMTLYHGRDNPPFVFSGFPPWYFQRAQAIRLVDFVLQDIWGLHRQPVPR